MLKDASGRPYICYRVRPTKVQREILAIMAHGEEIEDGCYDYPYAICVGQHRHMPRRTLDVLIRQDWVSQFHDPTSPGTPYYAITPTGRAAIGVS